MSSYKTEAHNVTVTFTEVEAKVLEWALQLYMESEKTDPNIAALSTQLRSLAVGFQANRGHQRSPEGE
jgi:hypothetical protein